MNDPRICEDFCERTEGHEGACRVYFLGHTIERAYGLTHWPWRYVREEPWGDGVWRYAETLHEAKGAIYRQEQGDASEWLGLARELFYGR